MGLGNLPVASRRPENPIGWTFCTGGLVLSVAVSATNYAEYALDASTGSLPGVEYAAWIATWAPIPTLFLIATMLFLLFPNGKLPSREWGFVAWTAVVASVMVALGEALALLVGFMLVEVVVGIIASSLALISDAGHMLTDAGGIGLALVTMSLAARPARGAMTYGLKRAEILSAQANGITLLLLSAWFVYEAIRRLIDPPEVEGGLVLGIALLGIVVNVLATWTISKANRESLNVEGAFQHILTDLFAFIATAIAGAIIYFTGGYNRVDAIAALVVAGLMLRAGYGLARDSGRIFLEAAPKGLNSDEVGHAMASRPGVVDVHDLHVWEVTSGFPALSAHVLVDPESDCHEERQELARLLEERLDLRHTTLQVDHATPEVIELSSKEDPDEGLDHHHREAVISALTPSGRTAATTRSRCETRTPCTPWNTVRSGSPTAPAYPKDRLRRSGTLPKATATSSTRPSVGSSRQRSRIALPWASCSRSSPTSSCRPRLSQGPHGAPDGQQGSRGRLEGDVGVRLPLVCAAGRRGSQCGLRLVVGRSPGALAMLPVILWQGWETLEEAREGVRED